MRYGIYSTETGQIHCIIGGTDIDRQAGPGQSAIAMPDGDDSTHRVNTETGRRVKMAPTPGEFSSLSVPADGQSLLSISGLIDNTFVSVIGNESRRHATASGLIELPFNSPGVYRITLAAGFPYAPREVTVYAT